MQGTTPSTPQRLQIHRDHHFHDISNPRSQTQVGGVEANLKGATHQSPLPRPSPLPVLVSRLELWPAAAEAKLDGMCEGIMDR
jgi:hypothetical protein